MTRKKNKTIPKDQSLPVPQTVKKNKENGAGVGFTKILSMTTQQEPSDFDMEAFKESLSDFFDCKTASIGKSFENLNGYDDNYVGNKCCHCNKENTELKKCTDCKAVSYCGRACQKADWQKHKAVCRKNKTDVGVEASNLKNSEQEEPKKTDTVVDMKGDSNSKPSVQGVCSYCNSHHEDLKTCVRCKKAVYCDKDCQRAHWPEHKKSCGRQDHSDGKKTADALSERTNKRSADDKHSLSGPAQKICVTCSKQMSTFIRCPKCDIAVYCNEQCKRKNRQIHKVACGKCASSPCCEVSVNFTQSLPCLQPGLQCTRDIQACGFVNLPDFVDALAKASDIIADYHECTGTEMVFPSRSETVPGDNDGSAVMLRIAETLFHPFRHGVVVEDVNGDRAPMFFYHEKSEETALLPKKLSGLLMPGNFIRWFYPHWHYFLDGTVGFRIDSLEEVEIMRSVTKFTFSPK